MDEREFELINILGADLGVNQREISRHMNLSLGMINMLIRRLIAKGYIRIEQLNKRKVQYILTPQGFAEKMRKSVKYTLKTISSISLIKNRIHETLLGLYEKGVRDFYFYGNPDIRILVEMVFKVLFDEHCRLHVIQQIPETKLDGMLLVCKEGVEEGQLLAHDYVDMITEIAKESNYMIGAGDATSVEQS